MLAKSELYTVDNLSRLAVMFTYTAALLALWFRIEFLAGKIKHAHGLAELAFDVARGK